MSALALQTATLQSLHWDTVLCTELHGRQRQYFWLGMGRNARLFLLLSCYLFCISNLSSFYHRENLIHITWKDGTKKLHKNFSLLIRRTCHYFFLPLWIEFFLYHMLHFMNIYTNKSQLIVSARFQKMLTLFLSDDCHNTNSIQNRFQKIQSKTHETQLFVFFLADNPKL